MKSNEVFAQEMQKSSEPIKLRAVYVVVNWKFILPEMRFILSGSRQSWHVVVMVNTANESVQVKVPMEHAGKTMTDVIAGVDVELPTVMTMEPYNILYINNNGCI